MSRSPKRPVVYTIYDKISGVEFAFAPSTSRKAFGKAHREHFDRYGTIADNVYGAVEDVGRGLQALTGQGVSLVKAFRAAVAEVDDKYHGFSGAQIGLIQNMLVEFWERGPELKQEIEGLRKKRPRLFSDGAPRHIA